MVKLISVLFLLPLILIGQENENSFRKDPNFVIRTSSVTWDLNNHTLKLVVEEGVCKEDVKEKGTCEISKVDIKKTHNYSLDMDNAFMREGMKVLPFSTQEAFSVHKLLNLLEQYSNESHIWFLNDGKEPEKKNDNVIAKR